MFIDGPSGSNIELAKNLVLSAVNVTLSEQMTRSEHYSFPSFMGQPEALEKDLSEMNPIISVKVGDHVGQIWSLAAVSLEQIKHEEQRAKNAGVPLIASMCSGFDGWIYYGGVLNEEGIEASLSRWGQCQDLTPLMYTIRSMLCSP